MFAYEPAELWKFLPAGYLFTIAIETPILLIGLSARHSLRTRLFAGAWLTACTYPMVVLVLPLVLKDRFMYLLVAETFAPLAECALFWAAYWSREKCLDWSMWRDMAVVAVANLASFGLGEVIYHWEEAHGASFFGSLMDYFLR